mmetsp:Transcript_2903/g.8619  ORF Transcript_2903/g.8619 Transcript_2903/m.8619 type:complete len:214 (-) Transcript_2903:458-1099(-)
MNITWVRMTTRQKRSKKLLVTQRPKYVASTLSSGRSVRWCLVRNADVHSAAFRRRPCTTDKCAAVHCRTGARCMLRIRLPSPVSSGSVDKNCGSMNFSDCCVFLVAEFPEGVPLPLVKFGSGGSRNASTASLPSPHHDGVLFLLASRGRPSCEDSSSSSRTSPCRSGSEPLAPTSAVNKARIALTASNSFRTCTSRLSASFCISRISSLRAMC